MKDIVIDNSCASKHFATPIDPAYIKLIKWLLTCSNEPKHDAILVVSNKLLNEYYRSSRNVTSPTSISLIVAQLTKEDRLFKITNSEINQFIRKHYSKKIVKGLRCNKKDRYHIPVVLLSNRKMVLSEDKYFLGDLNNFPGFMVLASSRPENLPYDQ